MMAPLLLLLLLGFSNSHQHGIDATDNDVSTEEDFTTTILRMNNGSNEFLLEGDIVIPRQRNAMRCFSESYSCLWPKSTSGYVVVPFILSEKYDPTERREIFNAMRDMESKTCIRFAPRDPSARGYLSIEPRYGCASLLGYVGDRQTVSLQRYGCIQKGIIQHELLHALGFYHEHNRSDRDEYIKVHWENINKYFVRNFVKKDTDNLNMRYDYSSVMHYGRTAFGGGKETMTPTLDPSAPIGQKTGMSPSDVLKVNKLYKCWNYMG